MYGHYAQVYNQRVYGHPEQLNMYDLMVLKQIAIDFTKAKHVEELAIPGKIKRAVDGLE